MSNSQKFWASVCFAVSLCIPLLVITSYTTHTFAQVPASAMRVDEEYLKKRSVRVIVSGKDVNGKPWAKVSSGFLWKNKQEIVTSLHGVPPNGNIRVKCMGTSQQATVEAVLEAADLILLKATNEFSNCEAFNGYDQEGSGAGRLFWTYGWRDGAQGGLPRFMNRSSNNPETLRDQLTDPALSRLDVHDIPSLDMGIYMVQGGLLPGYSGAPVITPENNLVGIADGGLNKGADNYNWLIPASHLDNLDRNNKVIPDKVAKLAGILFSSTTMSEPEPVEVFSSGSLAPIPDDVIYSEGEWNYRWEFVKTQSLYQLSQTSDDGDGVLGLLTHFSAAATGLDIRDLLFDVYEDRNLGLIIVVPSEQGLSYGEVEGNPEFYLLESTSNNGFRSVQYKQTNWSIMSSLNPTVSVEPSDPRYFQELTADLLASCNETPGQSCSLIKPILRMIDFGGGHKLLKLGFRTRSTDNGQPTKLDYYSYAVKGNTAFRSHAEILAESELSMLNCAESQPAACGDYSIPRQELSQMLAVHLSTFANLDANASQRMLNQTFVYSASADSSDTLRVDYQQNGQRTFYNSRGKVWQHHVPPVTVNLYGEVSRNQVSVRIKSGETEFEIPIEGGEYFKRTGDGQWIAQGTLQR